VDVWKGEAAGARTTDRQRLYGNQAEGRSRTGVGVHPLPGIGAAETG